MSIALVSDVGRRHIESRDVEGGVDGPVGSFIMISTRTRSRSFGQARSRRGALLLLVLSMLTLFLMIGTLMLALATRARTTARAFADVVSDGGLANLAARDLLDEALMGLLRGRQPPPAPTPPPPESILADRYGSTTLQGSITGLTPGGAVLQATVTGINAPDLPGRILTIKPQSADAAPIQSFRIIAVNGQTFELANLRTVEPFRTLPSRFPCEVFVNGREFGGEAWDAADASNPWLQPAGVPPNPADAVDNDGDGNADGTLLPAVLPPQRAGRTARVSFLVRDLDGCLNVNAHGSANAAPGAGPASIDGTKVFTDPTVWPGLMSGVNSPASLLPPTVPQRRAPPGLGGTVNSRFGSGPADTYALRLDFDGSRFSTLRSTIGNVFTTGELERVLRQFDADAGALSPRLAAILGTSAEAARLLVTTDSWDTYGVVGGAVSRVAGADQTQLAPEVREGLRFDLNRPLTDDAAKQAYFRQLLATVVAAGAPAAQAPQWVANVVDFRDADTTPGTYTPAAGPPVTGVEPPADGTWGAWNADRFESVGELLGVHGETKAAFDNLQTNNLPVPPSLAVQHPQILDAVGVPSRFATTITGNAGGRTLNRWREPGRVNVNTCNQQVWDAVIGRSMANPFATTPARSMSDVLLNTPGIFTAPTRDPKTLDRTLANRLANIATCRSNVFAVWITLELVDPDIRGGSPSLHRLFAIVDRSVPAGFALGQDLNARDTVRLLRYLE
jgi:hypothetical protein